MDFAQGCTADREKDRTVQYRTGQDSTGQYRTGQYWNLSEVQLD